MREWNRSSMIQYWDAVGAKYQLLFKDEFQGKPFDLKVLDAFAGSLKPGARVCDVGCGPCGHVTRLLADRRLDVIGVDVSPVCVDLARQLQRSLPFEVMDASALEFSISSLDGIVAYYLFHYIPLIQWPDVLSEFRRVVRPGGRILIVLKTGAGEGWIPDPLGETPDVFWAARSLKDLEEIVESSDFQITLGEQRGAMPREIAVDRIYLQAVCSK